jgi:alpha-glucosidase
MNSAQSFRSRSGRISIALLGFAIVIGLLFLLKTDDVDRERKNIPVALKWLGENKKSATLKFQKANDQWEIQFLKDNLVRVQIKPDGIAEANTAVLADQTWATEISTKLQEQDDLYIYETDKLRTEIDARTETVAFFDNENQNLLKMLKIDDLSYEVAFSHESGEQFYGIHGFHANQESSQKMMRDGIATIEAGTQGNAGAPFIWSLKNFGILFDTIDGSFSNFEKTLAIQGRSKTDLQYFVMSGKPLELQKTLAELTGKPPLFPKWSIGFNNSEWGIDQKELEHDVALYREKQIPIDNYTLDFDWKAWGEDNFGESRWNTKKFPDGPSGALKQRMDQLGIKLTGIMKPRIHVDTIQGKEATKNNYWWPGLEPFDDYFSKQKVNVLNFSLPEMRKWYFNQHVIDSYKTGIIGWWNDEADEMFDNLQFMNMQRTLYHGQRSLDNQRVWSINRNFFLGSQRYAYGLWSGDINTGFFSMAKQRERLLSAVNLGQAKWGMDTGGFHGTPSPQNYARWIQFSAFTPMFRVHGTLDEQRQPWVYGDQAEKVAKSAIELRYQLVPYIYSYERQAYETGIGLVKPLFFDYPSDQRFANYVDAWMFGDHLLVAPVVEEDQTEKEIELPTGKWIHYFSGKKYSGGQTIKLEIDANNWSDIPLFIKEGAIIPKYPVMDYIGERPVNTVNIDLYPSQKKTKFVFYDDDGKTYDYEKGVYFKQTISMKQSIKGKITIKLNEKTGSYNPESKTFVLHIHGIAANKVNGAKEWTTESGKYGPVTIVTIDSGMAKQIELQP